MEQGFGPRLSRVAGACSLLFLGVLDYFFGLRGVVSVLALPLLLALPLAVALPNSSRKWIIGPVASSVDIGSLFTERSDDRFDNLTRRLRR